MVLKNSIKSRRRNRNRRKSKKNRRHLQKGAGYSFKLDCNLPGGVAEVVTYNDYGPSQADSQLAPGQAQVEVVGVSNENLAPVEQQVPQQAQVQQTGGKRSRRRRRRRSRRSNRKPRKSLRRRRRKTSVKRRRRSRRQSGGDFNCPNCNMATRTFGCKQPLWDAKCI